MDMEKYLEQWSEASLEGEGPTVTDRSHYLMSVLELQLQDQDGQLGEKITIHFNHSNRAALFTGPTGDTILLPSDEAEAIYEEYELNHNAVEALSNVENLVD